MDSSTRSCCPKAVTSSAPPSAKSPPRWALRALTSSGTTSLTMVVFQPASFSVLEYTILVMPRQMRAKSATGPVLEGSESAVGQNPAMSS